MNIPKSLRVAMALKDKDGNSLTTELHKSKSWLYLVLKGERELSMGALQEICDWFEMPVSEFIALGE